jgi:hypothetical protein
MIDTVKTGMTLATQAMNIVHGGFSAAKINDARQLLGSATSFFKGLTRGGGGGGETNEDGLGEEKFMEDWKNEGKDVWMFSGCADNQTSAEYVVLSSRFHYSDGAGAFKTCFESCNLAYLISGLSICPWDSGFKTFARCLC